MPDVKTLDSTIYYQESGSGTPFVYTPRGKAAR